MFGVLVFWLREDSRVLVFWCFAYPPQNTARGRIPIEIDDDEEDAPSPGESGGGGAGPSGISPGAKPFPYVEDLD